MVYKGIERLMPRGDEKSLRRIKSLKPMRFLITNIFLNTMLLNTNYLPFKMF